jgi:predicted dehydrogenase
MVKQARQLVRSGELGAILKVVVEYPQGWLSSYFEKPAHRPATARRTDPRRHRRAAGCIAGIGTHAENLARYITGLQIEALCADLTGFVPGRKVEDDGNILLRFKGGARGVLLSSQICTGDENNLNIRVYGTKAGLEWYQEYPNELVVKYPDQPRRIYRRGNGYLGGQARKFARIPPGHPEGYLEAFGNIYREAFRAIAAEVEGKPLPQDRDYPTIDDGVIGMTLIETAAKSARRGAKWVKFPDA